MCVYSHICLSIRLYTCVLRARAVCPNMSRARFLSSLSTRNNLLCEKSILRFLRRRLPSDRLDFAVSISLVVKEPLVLPRPGRKADSKLLSLSLFLTDFRHSVVYPATVERRTLRKSICAFMRPIDLPPYILYELYVVKFKHSRSLGGFRGHTTANWEYSSLTWRART